MQNEFKPKRGPYTVEKEGEDFKVVGPHGMEKGQRIEQLNERKVSFKKSLKKLRPS